MEIINLAGVEAFPVVATAADVPMMHVEDGTSAIYVEAPGLTADEIDWLAHELQKVVAHRIAAIRVVRHAERIARQAVSA